MVGGFGCPEAFRSHPDRGKCDNVSLGILIVQEVVFDIVPIDPSPFLVGAVGNGIEIDACTFSAL